MAVFLLKIKKKTIYIDGTEALSNTIIIMSAGDLVTYPLNMRIKEVNAPAVFVKNRSHLFFGC